MSADRATCPRCVKRAEVTKAAQVTKAAASYAKVPEQEYAEAIAAIKDVRPEDCRRPGTTRSMARRMAR
jgi:hypothetical protein